MLPRLVVLEPDCLVRAVLDRDEGSFQAVRAILSGHTTLVLSPAVISRYQALADSRAWRSLGPHPWLDILCRLATFWHQEPEARGHHRGDPIRFSGLTLARAAGAVLLTHHGDRFLVDREANEDQIILTPGDYIYKTGAPSRP